MFNLFIVSFCLSSKIVFSLCIHHYPQLVFKAAAAAAINDQIVQIRFVKLPFNVNMNNAEAKRETERKEQRKKEEHLQLKIKLFYVDSVNRADVKN